MLLSRLETLYDAGEVKRLHTVPTIRNQTVGEHTYGTMIIAMELISLNHGRAAQHMCSLSTVGILYTLLTHDAPEVTTGDMPAPTKIEINAILGKWGNVPGADVFAEMEKRFYEQVGIKLPELNEMEEDIVKAADCLDLAFTCVKERLLGNRHPKVEEVYQNVKNYLTAKRHIIGTYELTEHLDNVWRSV